MNFLTDGWYDFTIISEPPSDCIKLFILGPIIKILNGPPNNHYFTVNYLNNLIFSRFVWPLKNKFFSSATSSMLICLVSLKLIVPLKLQKNMLGNHFYLCLNFCRGVNYCPFWPKKLISDVCLFKWLSEHSKKSDKGYHVFMTGTY